MSPKTKYALLEGQQKYEKFIRYSKLVLLAVLCLLSLVALCLTWTVVQREVLRYPPESLNNLPIEFIEARIAKYAKLQGHRRESVSIDFPLSPLASPPPESANGTAGKFRIVCYYNFPKHINVGEKTKTNNQIKGGLATDELLPKDIDPHLCTHLNVGFVPIVNNSLALDANQQMYLNTQIRDLRRQNKDLKILFWIGGGAFDYGFPEMVRSHKTRKQFIQSLKYNLETFSVDGVDLDWEFPSPYNKDRQHFSQLLYEIRREYQREHQTYLLTIAMPAPAQYQDALYDIAVINENVDFVNVMAYDYNQFSASTPFTGINAPLFPSAEERDSLFAYLNINYTAYNLHAHGLERSKIVIGLPTYGHSFRLVSPFNHHIHSPAAGNGRLGQMGFVSYSAVCWFAMNNFYVNSVYDEASCSPYLYSVFEWVSYDDERSIECKSRWIRDGRFGGAMIFSLNADDFNLVCLSDGQGKEKGNNRTGDDFKFPLTRKVREILNP